MCLETARRDEEVDEIRIDRRLLLESVVNTGRRQSVNLWCLLHLQIARLQDRLASMGWLLGEKNLFFFSISYP